jgi:hypothetical protein
LQRINEFATRFWPICTRLKALSGLSLLNNADLEMACPMTSAIGLTFTTDLELLLVFMRTIGAFVGRPEIVLFCWIPIDRLPESVSAALNSEVAYRTEVFDFAER